MQNPTQVPIEFEFNTITNEKQKNNNKSMEGFL